ncbi:outer envelope pore protein 16-3, chloroplastic/mitochondrial [Tanacetum coccineum]
MDTTDRRYLEEEDSSLTKTMKGAATGLAAGTIWGTIVATWLDVPRVERNVALPGLIRTLKMMGNHGLTFAAIGGVYIGVEQLTQNYRMKRDFVNGAVGGFVAGAAILGFKGQLHVNSFKCLRCCLSPGWGMRGWKDRQRGLRLFKINHFYATLGLEPKVKQSGSITIGKSISTALSAGAALAATSAAIDVGGQTTRMDTGKEYYPYTTKKRADVAN